MNKPKPRTLSASPIRHRQAKAVPPIHPGTYLHDELLAELHVSQNALAKATGIPVSRINQIVLGRRSVSAETDLRLCRYFGLSHGFFLRWQARYDQLVAERDHGAEVEAEVTPLELAHV